MNNDWLRADVLVLVVVLSAIGVVRPRVAPVAGTAAATLAALAAWFYGVTSTTAPMPLKISGVAGLAVTAASTGWLAVAVHLEHVRGRPANHWPSRILVAVAVTGVLLMLARPVSVTPATAAVDYLKPAWVGLDIAELASLVLLACGLHHRSTWTILVATTTAALLGTDALINTVPASGEDRLIALVMALVELPLAIAALSVAVVLLRRGRLLDEMGTARRAPRVSGRPSHRDAKHTSITQQSGRST